jgi:hypothetical protein
MVLCSMRPEKTFHVIALLRQSSVLLRMVLLTMLMTPVAVMVLSRKSSLTLGTPITTAATFS